MQSEVLEVCIKAKIECSTCRYYAHIGCKAKFSDSKYPLVHNKRGEGIQNKCVDVRGCREVGKNSPKLIIF